MLDECYKYFSTEQAAKKYVINNKPRLSLMEVTEILNDCKWHNRDDRKDEDYYVAYTTLIEMRLKELAEKKLNL